MGNGSVNLIDKLRASAEAERAEAGQTYREILLRADSPRKDDEKTLRRAMDVLGYGVDRLQRDLAVLKQAAELEAQAEADTPELGERVEAAGKAWSDHDAETERIKQQRQAESIELKIAFGELQRQQGVAREAHGKLAGLRRKHFALFGEPEPQPEPVPCLVQSPTSAPDAGAIEAENAKVPTSLPWGSATDGGAQIGAEEAKARAAAVE